MKLPSVLRLFTLYFGLAFVGDKLVRPSIIARKARKIAGKLNKPVLNIGHRLTSGVVRQMFKAPALWGDINIDIDARAAAADPRLTYANPAALPFPNDSMGAVILLHIIEDAEDPLAIATEADRVLAPGGTIFAVTPPWWTPHAWIANKWLLVDLPTGTKHVYKLWQRRKPTLTEAFAAAEGSQDAQTAQDTPSSDTFTADTISV